MNRERRGGAAEGPVTRHWGCECSQVHTHDQVQQQGWQSRSLRSFPFSPRAYMHLCTSLLIQLLASCLRHSSSTCRGTVALATSLHPDGSWLPQHASVSAVCWCFCCTRCSINCIPSSSVFGEDSCVDNGCRWAGCRTGLPCARQVCGVCDSS